MYVGNKYRRRTNLKKCIFEALESGAQFKVSDRTEPVQQNYVIHKSPSPPLLFRHIWQLGLNLVHSDSKEMNRIRELHLCSSSLQRESTDNMCRSGLLTLG